MALFCAYPGRGWSAPTLSHGTQPNGICRISQGKRSKAVYSQDFHDIVAALVTINVVLRLWPSSPTSINDDYTSGNQLRPGCRGPGITDRPTIVTNGFTAAGAGNDASNRWTAYVTYKTGFKFQRNRSATIHIGMPQLVIYKRSLA